MSFWKTAQDRAVVGRMQEDAVYAAALEEFESGARRKGIWAKALIEAEGDLPRSEAAYLRLLVAAMKDDLYVAERLQEALSNQHARTTINGESHQTAAVAQYSRVRQAANSILQGRAEYHACESLIKHAGGIVEARGIIFGIHYLVRFKGKEFRLNRFEDLVAWIATNLPVERWAIDEI